MPAAQGPAVPRRSRTPTAQRLSSPHSSATGRAVPGNIEPTPRPARTLTGKNGDTVVRHVFAMEAPVNVAKTVSSITLPQATGGDMHVFAMTLPPAPAHAVTATPANQKGAGKAG